MSFLIQQGPLALFFAFTIMHALADFPLQGEFLAIQKARRTANDRRMWVVALTAHCLIQAGGVWLVSGSMAFAATELLLHGLIDLGKGEQRFGILVDQGLHLLCKLVYALILTHAFTI